MLERKDQIDSLLDLGIPAGRLDSTMSHLERNETYERLRARQLKLLYVSPERLLIEGTDSRQDPRNAAAPGLAFYRAERH